MEEKKRRDWKKIAAAVFCAVLLGLNLWQLRQISDLRGQLGSVETNLQMETRRLDERLVNVQRAAQEADAAVLDWEYTTAVNRETRSLGVAISVTLKEWRPDTAVELVWTAEAGETGGPVSLTHNGVGTFTGTLDLPVEQSSQGVSLDVKIMDDETARRESLGYLDDVPALLPVQSSGWSYSGPDYTRDKDRNGTLTIPDCDIWLEGCKGESLSGIFDAVFRLRRNGEIAAEKTAMFGDTLQQYTCWDLTSEAQIGDSLDLTFFCRDESGLGYEFFLNGWEIDENGIKDAVSSSPEADWPRLTWD